MIDINTISKLKELPTPFYYYDTDLLKKTCEKVNHPKNTDTNTLCCKSKC